MTTSTDRTPRTGTQAVDELVPSRYAVPVGDIQVLVISDGVLPITAGTLATNADADAYSTWLSDQFLPQDVLDWPLNVVVVRTADRTILVDAGLGVEFPDFPRAGQTVHRLEAAGIDPSAVTDVVLTHLHMDHVGGLLSEGLKERLRPDLRIHVASAEANFWESPDFSHTEMPAPVPPALRAIATRFLDEYRSHIHTFESEYDIAPGVHVERTGGHTPGHSVVHVTSGDDRLTFAGDLVFQVGFEHPEWYNGFEHDPAESARVRINLLRETAETGGLLVATHMPFPSIGHVAAHGDTFRWVPAIWDY